MDASFELRNSVFNEPSIHARVLALGVIIRKYRENKRCHGSKAWPIVHVNDLVKKEKSIL
jgi:hypothetical protein